MEDTFEVNWPVCEHCGWDHSELGGSPIMISAEDGVIIYCPVCGVEMEKCSI